MAAQTTATNSSSAKPMADSLRLCASCCRRVKVRAASRGKRPSFQVAADSCHAAVSRRCLLRALSRNIPSCTSCGRAPCARHGLRGSSFQAPETPSRQRKGWDVHELGKWPTGRQSVWLQSSGRPSGWPVRQRAAAARSNSDSPANVGRACRANFCIGRAASPRAGTAGYIS